MKKQKKYKIFIQNYILSGGFYIKLSITIFLIALYILLFFMLDGMIYFESYNYPAQYKKSEFQIHFIDVEDGDAIILRLPNKRTIMIDTGEGEYYNHVDSYLRQYKYYEKISTIDCLILTHLDSDHIGNADKLLDDYKIKNIYRPTLYSTYEVENNLATENYGVYESELYDSIIKKAYQKNCNLIFSQKGLELSGENYKIEFLSPAETYYKKSNNYSAVVMLTYKGKKFLFMGDAEKEIEEKLIEDYGSYLSADVLKLGHHGSATSSSEKFLDVVNPKYAVVSSGLNNFPSGEVTERMRSRNIRMLMTSNLNSFVLSLKDDQIVYCGAKESVNYLDLILTIFIIIIFIVWKNPFSAIDVNEIKNYM